VLTAEAAVTLGAEGQGMVAGDLVNTASRVQSAAEPGTVLVGEATRRASEAAIAYADAGTHELKGKAEPVQLWQALRVTAGRAGALKSAGPEPPFVGSASRPPRPASASTASPSGSQSRSSSTVSGSSAKAGAKRPSPCSPRRARSSSGSGPRPRSSARHGRRAGSLNRPESRHNGPMARVLLGVTGGIAAYKACELARLLVKAGHDVVPLLTRGATRFVSEETFLALTRRARDSEQYPHLVRADLLVVAPCTAHTLARLAHGLADDVLTEAALAHRGPVLVAPAMNVRMWEHPATQANAAALRARGVELVGPEEGELAEGEWGAGRMSEPAAIAHRCEEVLARADGPLAGKRVLVSAGGTREPLDAVRFVGNRSSGRMGVALAAEARRRGADVTLLAANLAVAAPPGVAVVETPTAEAMAEAALVEEADVVLMAAAVADYSPGDARGDKRPKDDEEWLVRLRPTVDILRELGKRKNGALLVGFAADTGARGIERAREKLANKGASLIVFNDVSRSDIGFDAPDNEVVLVSRDGERAIGKAPKEAIAAAVLDEVERLLREGHGGSSNE
jgi:phosphopantothenoylcysteine decarboxylase/phosphopantothenate--cysteine ligase